MDCLVKNLVKMIAGYSQAIAEFLDRRGGVKAGRGPGRKGVKAGRGRGRSHVDVAVLTCH